MKLSVVIVSYNVRSYLEECLKSVQKALEGIEGEVFVVDNHSDDDSVETIRNEYPWVKLIVRTLVLPRLIIRLSERHKATMCCC